MKKVNIDVWSWASVVIEVGLLQMANAKSDALSSA